jgi:hypothetical protein
MQYLLKKYVTGRYVFSYLIQDMGKRMKSKIEGIFVCLLLIGTAVLPVASSIYVIKNSVEEHNMRGENIHSTSVDDIDWQPMFQHDYKRLGYSTSTAPNTDHILWKYKEANGGFAHSIVIADNRVYAGSIGNLLNKYQGTFYCFDANDSQTPTIIGPYSGLAGVEYEYKLVTIDPNGNDIYYGIDWGDNSGHEWIGPYPSGEEVTVKHTWNKHGNYIIKTKAKDIYGHESDWGTLEVSMPKNTQTQVFTLNESLDTNQYFVFLKGKCDSMGIGGRVIHIGPFWYCKNFGVVSYTMEKNSILIVNGNKQEVNFPAFIAFYRFKGYGPFVPIFIYKAITQGKIRVIGVCDEISISPV